MRQRARPTPPYIPFEHFLDVIDLLQPTAVPEKITNAALPRNATLRAQVRSALRFLRLIDHNDRPTSALRSLIAARYSDDWQRTLKGIVRRAYRPIIRGEYGDMSIQDIRKALISYGLKGQMVEKCFRFLLSAGTGRSLRPVPLPKAVGIQVVFPLKSGSNVTISVPMKEIAMEEWHVIDAEIRFLIAAHEQLRKEK